MGPRFTPIGKERIVNADNRTVRDEHGHYLGKATDEELARPYEPTTFREGCAAFVMAWRAGWETLEDLSGETRVPAFIPRGEHPGAIQLHMDFGAPEAVRRQNEEGSIALDGRPEPVPGSFRLSDPGRELHFDVTVELWFHKRLPGPELARELLREYGSHRWPYPAATPHVLLDLESLDEHLKRHEDKKIARYFLRHIVVVERRS